jgi:hypothetical protein
MYGAGLSFAESLEEKIVVGNNFQNDLAKTIEVRTVDDRMNAELECQQGIEGVAGVAEEEHSGMTPLGHGHELQGLEGAVFGNVLRVEEFIDDDDGVGNLAETSQEIIVILHGMNFVPQILENDFHLLLCFEKGGSEQSGPICGAEKIVAGHVI